MINLNELKRVELEPISRFKRSWDNSRATKPPPSFLRVILKEDKTLRGYLRAQEGLIKHSAGNETRGDETNEKQSISDANCIQTRCSLQTAEGRKGRQIAEHALFINTKTYFLLPNGSCYGDGTFTAASLRIRRLLRGYAAVPTFFHHWLITYNIQKQGYISRQAIRFWADKC